MKKATIKKAKELSRLGGWGNFKHRLMTYLDIPANQFDSWDVPQEWKEAWMKANGRTTSASDPFGGKRTKPL